VPAILATTYLAEYNVKDIDRATTGDEQLYPLRR
jgi:hypothetical protein